MGRERRRHERVEKADISVCCRFNDGSALRGDLENISLGGCYLRGDDFAGCNRWEPCLVEMELAMPPETLRFPARLIWSDLRGAGFSFSDLDETMEKKLAALVS